MLKDEGESDVRIKGKKKGMGRETTFSFFLSSIEKGGKDLFFTSICSTLVDTLFFILLWRCIEQSRLCIK